MSGFDVGNVLSYQNRTELRIEKRLDEGEKEGTAIYRARDNVLGRTILLKIISDLDPVSKKTVENEVKNMILVEEKTEYTPTVYGLFWDAKNHSYTISMQYIEGKTLRELMEEKEKWEGRTLQDRLELWRQICEVTAQIHKVPAFYHKDLKPENILVRKERTKTKVYVIDFGISGPTGFRNVGTEKYMAPEQKAIRKGMAPSQATDVFALGLIGYELLTGRVPVISIDYTYTSESSVWKSMPDITKENQQLTKADKLKKILDRATAMYPKDRYRNAEELYVALKNLRL